MTNDNENRAQELGRREFLKKGLIWSGESTAAVALGSAAGAVATGDVREYRKGKKRGKCVTFDVACLGESFRIIFAPGAPDSGDLRGSTFSVEGSIYPEGAIRRRWVRPRSAEAIGRWLCRGWFLLNEEDVRRVLYAAEALSTLTGNFRRAFAVDREDSKAAGVSR